MHYQCKDCGGMMEYDKQTTKGERYKCKSCGCMGYMDGMEESSNGAGINPSDFGL